MVIALCYHDKNRVSRNAVSAFLFAAKTFIFDTVSFVWIENGKKTGK